MKRKRWRIAGINFDHFHMGDLLRYTREHPQAEIVGISDEQPERMEEAIGKLGIARVEVILANGDLIIPKDDGVGAKVRQGVAWSVKYLLLSVSWLIVGLLLILPWGLVGYAGYRVVRRLVKAS